MNIAIFSPNKNPYSETFIQAHKKYLKGKVFYYYGKKSNMNLEGFDSLNTRFRQRVLKFERKIKGFSDDELQTRTILSSLKLHKIDVVLVEYGTHAYNLKGALQTCGVPVLVHFHGYDASVKAIIKQCDQYRGVFSLATKVIAVSKIMKERLINLGCHKNKIIYTPCAPNPSFENVLSKLSKKQFLSIGRFTDKKAPYYTIMAFKEVANKYPDTRLLMSGDGVLLNMCKNLVNYYKLKNQVIFLGVISAQEYQELLSESLAYVQHSITAENGDMEGTPVSILEASIAGLPVVATKHAGIPDVIVHGRTGLLCDEHDVQGMADHMLQLIENQDMAEQMGVANKDHILEHFSMQRHIEILQNTLEESCSHY